MRLTLRTLLAYLDNTLDPQDAEALKSKLGESGFATQLVQRICSTSASGTLPAPSPEAVGPVEEANVISEYLDSTLPTEQVAEIERACLESDPHLAEAAACHQILTMVLGKPAEVSPELRQRIYELPDRRIEDIAAAGSFSAVAIPEQQSLQPLGGDLPAADLSYPSQPVKPVGVGDSGVSDAPTRLRESGAVADGNGLDSALAGSKPRAGDDGGIYGGSVRSSRTLPWWLGSLALAAVLLFLLTRIFQPLLDKQTASVDPINNMVVLSEQEPMLVENGSQPSTADVAIDEPTEPDADAEAVPAPDVPPSEESAPHPEPVVSTESIPSEAPVVVDAAPAEDTSAVSQPGKTADVADADAGTKVDTTPPPSSAVATDAEKPKPPPAVASKPQQEIAKIISDKTLLAALVGDQWVRLEKDMMVGEGMKIICGPTFRGQMATADAEVTLVGPAQVEWLVDEADEPMLNVEFGQVLVSATKPDSSFKVRLGAQAVEVGFADIDSVAGASIKHFRPPGFDPLQVGNRRPLVSVLSVQGVLALNINGKPESLQTGLQWVKRGSNQALVSTVDVVPDWVDPPNATDTSLETSARDGLLAMIKGGQPLEIALREATLFRRSEVAALAGQSLLNLGISDIYFGGDGILSEPKQRAYWPDHFVALMSSVDRSAQSAAKLRESIVNMDSANANPLFRLLMGYSQKQLVEGGDEELVEMLDSSSMAVRVMALESLHKITGTTLYFRAEQENAVRRAPGIKKWIARQRKGDIRWQE